MKIIWAFLCLVAYCSAHRQALLDNKERSITASIVAAIEGLRDQMPCGFPEQGIPPLAPLHFTYQNVTYNRTGISIKGHVSDFDLNGLNEFVIDKLKVNIVASKITFKLLFNNVNVNTMYDLEAVLNKFGIAAQLQGQGPAKYALKNVVISGSIKYSYNIVSGHMKVKKLDVRINVGKAESDIEGLLVNGKFNEKLNGMLSVLGPKLINKNERKITKTIEKYGLPIINKQLESIVLKDAGGGGVAVNAKPKCNPNELS